MAENSEGILHCGFLMARISKKDDQDDLKTEKLMFLLLKYGGVLLLCDSITLDPQFTLNTSDISVSKTHRENKESLIISCDDLWIDLWELPHNLFARRFEDSSIDAWVFALSESQEKKSKRESPIFDHTSKQKLECKADLDVPYWGKCHFSDAQCGKHCLDLFLPTHNREDAPVALFVHGGGWRRGCRRSDRHFMSALDLNALVWIVMRSLGVYSNVGLSLAERGVPCAVMSYHLSLLRSQWVFVELLVSGVSNSVIFTTFTILLTSSYAVGQQIFECLFGLAEQVGDIYSRIMLSCFLIVRLGVFMVALLSLSKTTVPHIYKKKSLIFVSRNSFRERLGHMCFSMLIALSVTLFQPHLLITSTISLAFLLVILSMLIHFFSMANAMNSENVCKGAHTRPCAPLDEHQLQLMDVCLAIRWLLRNSSTYDSWNSRKISLIGHSAGAHLVMVLALCPGYLVQAGIPPNYINAVVGISGVYDLPRLASSFFARHLYVIPSFGTTAMFWKIASPVFLARWRAEHSQSIEYAKGYDIRESRLNFAFSITKRSCSRFFLLNAQLDLDLHAHTDIMVNALESIKDTEKDVHVRVSTVPKRNHFSIVGLIQPNDTIADKMVDEIVHFICS